MISPGPYGKYDRRHHQHVGGGANKPDSILAKHRVWLQEGLLWEHAEGGLGAAGNLPEHLRLADKLKSK